MKMNGLLNYTMLKNILMIMVNKLNKLNILNK